MHAADRPSRPESRDRLALPGQGGGAGMNHAPPRAQQHAV